MEKEQKPKERKRSLLEIQFNAKCKSQGKTKAEIASNVFHLSYVTLYRRLDSNKKLSPLVLSQLASYLEKDEEEILKLHNYIGDGILPIVEAESIKVTTFAKKTIIVSIILLVLITLFYFLSVKSLSFPHLLPKQEYSAMYDGEGMDIDLSVPTKIDDFHSKLYSYKFKNASATIVGTQITLIANVKITLLSDPSYYSIGKFTATGLYVGGKGALSYIVENQSNQETWIGVLMLDLPLTGPAEGYWLSIHSVPNTLSNGKFALGSVNLNRNKGLKID